MYYAAKSLAALEESVATLSGHWVGTAADPSAHAQWITDASDATTPGGQARQDFIDPRLLTPIGHQFTGKELVQGGIHGPDAIASSYFPGSVMPQIPSGPSVSSYFPSAADQPASGPDWTPQPGMMYAAGQAITPQDFINRYGMQTYLSVGGRVGGAPAGAAPSAGGPANYSSGSSPAQSQNVIGGPGIALQAQATGPQVSTGAATLDFKQYFHSGRTPAGDASTSTGTSNPTPTPQNPNRMGIEPWQRPNTKPTYPRPKPPTEPIVRRGGVGGRGGNPNLKDYIENDIVVHLFLLAGLLYLIGKVRIPKE